MLKKLGQRFNYSFPKQFLLPGFKVKTCPWDNSGIETKIKFCKLFKTSHCHGLHGSLSDKSQFMNQFSKTLNRIDNLWFRKLWFEQCE